MVLFFFIAYNHKDKEWSCFTYSITINISSGLACLTCSGKIIMNSHYHNVQLHCLRTCVGLCFCMLFYYWGFLVDFLPPFTRDTNFVIFYLRFCALRSFWKGAGNKCFPSRVDPFSKGRQNNLWWVAFPESVSILGAGSRGGSFVESLNLILLTLNRSRQVF